ncbi:hypothetical protein [Thermoanaerobacterium thermosaccharolyticum]|uniref:hypothetical protein n=1 Tax=Thermoanaerobacterium thermosaccharolyticum TaxID=1517 RepID=UPI0020A49170|nr:hypothetical protein [Thermoanaerobacterium thermosaccharolyticum]MCP2239140.1 hypothetical protein [Thermoanaerobacterium thermosaccharolyticum]
MELREVKKDDEIDVEKLVEVISPLLGEMKSSTQPIYIAKFILFVFLLILVNDTKISTVALNALVAASDIVSFFPAIYNIYSAGPISLEKPDTNSRIPPMVFPPPQGITKESFFGFLLLSIFTLLGFSNLQYLYAIYASLTYTFIPSATANLIKGLPPLIPNEVLDPDKGNSQNNVN